MTVGITADRRWEEQAALFERRGAAVLHGPTLRTVDRSHDRALQEATAALIASPPDIVIITTGVGLRWWLEAADGWDLGSALRAALASATVVARGAKAASAARGAGLEVAWQAPSERMDDVVGWLRAVPAIGDASVALQLFDDAHPSTADVAAIVGRLFGVPVYEWAPPGDEGPAGRLIAEAVGGHLAAVTFTSQPAVHGLFSLAGRMGVDDALRDALNSVVVPACVGPVCAEAAVQQGVVAPVWPDPPRLPAMVRLVSEVLLERGTGRDGFPGGVGATEPTPWFPDP
jgi:uroporphyrinogen-III synthase